MLNEKCIITILSHFYNNLNTDFKNLLQEVLDGVVVFIYFIWSAQYNKNISYIIVLLSEWNLKLTTKYLLIRQTNYLCHKKV